MGRRHQHRAVGVDEVPLRFLLAADQNLDGAVVSVDHESNLVIAGAELPFVVGQVLCDLVDDVPRCGGYEFDYFSAASCPCSHVSTLLLAFDCN